MKKIALVGEAWGKDEEFFKAPFMGKAGQELNRLLKEAGIERSSCFITNVLNLRPGSWWASRQPTFLPPPEDANDLKYVTVSLAEARALDSNYSASPISNGRYLHPLLLPEIERLREELVAFQGAGGNLAVALGGTALWALCGSAGISNARGAIQPSTLIPGLKILPSYHPAAVMREWSLRPVLLADLAKARRESEFPEIRRKPRTIYIRPSIEDLDDFFERHILKSSLLSVDIETERRQITCVGIAPSDDTAIVIPFSYAGHQYWEHPEDEFIALRWVKKVLELPIPKLGQNFMYDLQYFISYRIKVWMEQSEDTMLLHHALYPEMEKSLRFLGATYTNERSWKKMRPRGRKAEKKDE